MKNTSNIHKVVVHWDKKAGCIFLIAPVLTTPTTITTSYFTTPCGVSIL
jgi:hypothetical protein